MNTKTLMVALIAVLAVFALGFTSASIDSSDVKVSIDGVELSLYGATNIDFAAFAGETVPVRVYLSSDNADSVLNDVEVEVKISSGLKDSSDSFFLGNVIEDGRTYRTGIMNVQIPSKLDELTENLYVTVTVTADGERPYVYSYPIFAQRNAYQLDVVSMDFDNSASAGDVVPVSVVIKNRGYEDSQDGFVIVTIPELGVSAKAYFGDLVAIEGCDMGCDDEDTVQKVLNIKIPAAAKDGVYDLIAKVYDADSVTTVKESIQVSASSATQVIAPIKSLNVRAGETKTFELILVNSADKVVVYELKTVSGSDLTVSAPSVVIVDAGSSKTVQVTVSVAEDAIKGAYPFTVEANGQSTVLTANVSGKEFSVSAIALTVVLVIVFVILLAVLIVLLTRKDKPAADEVETSYY